MILPCEQRYTMREATMAVCFKGAHFPPDIILMGIRWYVAYPLSTRHVEELMEERGVEVDHSTINRWVIKYSPQLEEAFHRRKRPVWVSWRMDETYIKVKGQWRYLYRAVDKHGQTIDLLLTEHRDKEAALRFLKKAIRRNGVPETITIDGSDANEARMVKIFELAFLLKVACRYRPHFGLSSAPLSPILPGNMDGKSCGGETMDWKHLLAYITGTVDQELLLRNEYLVTEHRILRSPIKGRLRLSAGA